VIKPHHCARSKSFLAAEAIAAYVDSEEWQLGEEQAGMAELDPRQRNKFTEVLLLSTASCSLRQAE
jgi:hypothetical protein